MIMHLPTTATNQNDNTMCHSCGNLQMRSRFACILEAVSILDLCGAAKEDGIGLITGDFR